MDGFKKRVQVFLEELRKSTKRFIDRNWHNKPEGDLFRSWDVLFIIGVIRFKPTTKWQRALWILGWFLVFCNYYLVCNNFVKHVFGKYELLSSSWHSAVCLAVHSILLKDLILRNSFDTLQTARQFINGKPCSSGDGQADANKRKKIFQCVQLTVFGLAVTILLDDMFSFIPNSGIDQLFGVPDFVKRLLRNYARTINLTLVLVLYPQWVSKYASGTGLTCFILSGFKTELEIFVRGFENIMDHVQLDVQESLPPSTSTTSSGTASQDSQRDQLYWKYLKQHVTNHVKQHIELMENLQLLKPVVRRFFAVTYYVGIVIISLVIYVSTVHTVSGLTFTMISGSSVMFIECFLWCSIVDSFADINDDLEIEIMDLMQAVPHTDEYHKEYVEVRSMLLTMKMYVRNSCRFSCGGVFDLSVGEFARFADACYSGLTFLLSVAEKA